MYLAPRAILITSLLLLASCACPSGKHGKHDFREYKRYQLEWEHREPRECEIKVTYFGTSTLLFDDGTTQILVDGFVTRPSVRKVIFTRLSTDKELVTSLVREERIDRLGAMFVTHSHYDHALDVVEIIKAAELRKADRKPVMLYGSASTREIARGGGLAEGQIGLFKPGTTMTAGEFKVDVFISKHSPPTPAFRDIGAVIERPLRQPVFFDEYREGGTYDVLITHGKHTILVKAGANYIEGMLDGIHADVLFLGIGQLGVQCCDFQSGLYVHTVRALHPDLVIPIHWDNFFKPLSRHLPPARLKDDIPGALEFLSGKLQQDGIRMGLMQGYQSIILFASDPLRPEGASP